MRTNKIAILLATYQGELYIAQQIDSILNQSYKEWELFIHDDGSTDGTVKIIEEYQNKYPDRIHLLIGTPTGSAKNNFFYLMKKVDAPYIMFCDQDDIWLENKIEITYNAMKRAENRYRSNTPLMVFTDLKVVDKNLNVIAQKMKDFQQLNYSKLKFTDLMIQNVVTGCTMMINNSLLKMAIKAKEYTCIIMHDWWCALIASYYGKIVCADIPLTMYRQHGRNSIGAKNLKSMKYMTEKIKEPLNIRKSLIDTQIQVKLFVDTFCLKKDSIAFKYSDLNHKSKVNRTLFYIKNNIWKHGVIRNLGLIIYG